MPSIILDPSGPAMSAWLAEREEEMQCLLTSLGPALLRPVQRQQTQQLCTTSGGSVQTPGTKTAYLARHASANISVNMPWGGPPSQRSTVGRRLHPPLPPATHPVCSPRAPRAVLPQSFLQTHDRSRRAPSTAEVRDAAPRSRLARSQGFHSERKPVVIRMRRDRTEVNSAPAACLSCLC